MKRGVRNALAGSAIVLAAGAAGWWFLNLYSVSSPYDRYREPTREFLQAGLALDSVRLARIAAAEPVQWVLETGRRHPIVLRDLLRDLDVVGGRHIGDATSVLFAGWHGGTCRNHLLSLTFEGRPEAPRIRDLSTDCQSPR